MHHRPISFLSTWFCQHLRMYLQFQETMTVTRTSHTFHPKVNPSIYAALPTSCRQHSAEWLIFGGHY